LRVLNKAFGNPLKSEEQAIAPFAGGIMQHGFQCGMLWGSALACGAQAYHLHGSGPEAKTRTVAATQRLIETFRNQNDHINCVDITHLDKSSSTKDMVMKFLIKGQTISCLRMAGKYGPSAFDEIKAVLADETMEVQSDPVSCATLLAEKIGASEEHALMVAGFAGGIGLSGGACGALGAAIWIKGMRLQEEHEIKNLWGDKDYTSMFDALMDRFLKLTEYEFECSNITGRKFKDTGDHAEFVCQGGCSKLIEELARG
jgi:hypothetical protein